MNFFITITRLFIAIGFSIPIIEFWLFLFPVEVFFEIIFFPIYAIFLDRESFRNTWVGSFPNTLKFMFSWLHRLWVWVRDD